MDKRIIDDFDSRLGRKMKDMEDVITSAAKVLESRLWDAVNSELLKLDTVAGKILLSQKNALRMMAFNQIFEEHKERVVKMLESKAIPILDDFLFLARDYYQAIGFSAPSLILDRLRPTLYQSIGISDFSRIMKGGKIYEEVIGLPIDAKKAELLNTVFAAMSTNQTLNSVIGKPDFYFSNPAFRKRSAENAAASEEYFKLFNTFNATYEVVNKEFADEMGLEYFIYQGSLIAGSREFCKERAGKVFSTADAKKWINDPNLVVSKKFTYNPLLHRGGYRCRHWIRYISEETAITLGYKK